MFDLAAGVQLRPKDLAGVEENAGQGDQKGYGDRVESARQVQGVDQFGQDQGQDRLTAAVLTGDVFQLSKQSGSSPQRILISGHETFQLCFCSCVILVLSLLSGPAAPGLFGL